MTPRVPRVRAVDSWGLTVAEGWYFEIDRDGARYVVSDPDTPLAHDLLGFQAVRLPDRCRIEVCEGGDAAVEQDDVTALLCRAIAAEDSKGVPFSRATAIAVARRLVPQLGARSLRALSGVVGPISAPGVARLVRAIEERLEELSELAGAASPRQDGRSGP